MNAVDRFIFTMMFAVLAALAYANFQSLQDHRARTEKQIQTLVRCAYMEEGR